MPTIKGITVSSSQKDIYNVLKEYGPLPDHALVPLAQHALSVHQSSSGIRTRRAELARLGLVKAAGRRVTGSGRQATTFKAVR